MRTSTVVTEQSPSIVWVGSRRGAFRVNRDTGAGQYFAGRRWLPDDHVTGIGFRRRVDLDRDSARVFTHRVQADDACRQVACVRRACAGTAQPLGTHGRFSIPSRRRRLVESADFHRQRRPVDGNLCRGRVVSFQGDGRGRCARERPRRDAGAHAPGVDHRYSGISRAVVHQSGRRRTAGRR